jgi:4'-phosphopantetheinyl transferase
MSPDSRPGTGTDVVELWFVPREGCHATRDAVLARALGVATAAIGWSVSRNGRPELRDADGVDCNLSHTGAVAAIAVTRGRRVGVDVETVRRDTPVGRLAHRFFPADQAGYVGTDPERYYRLWTRKEACVKAVGGRLAQSLGLPVLRTGPIAARRGALAGCHWFVADVPAPDGLLASVAATGPRPFTVLLRQSALV